MAVFEIEKDGELFELDAPDMQSAVKALGSYSPQQQQADEPASVSGFLRNAGRDVGELAGGLAQAVMHPIDTGRAIAENPYGLVEPYAEMAKDPLGYTYERPLSAALNVSSVTGVGGAIGTAVKAGGRAGKVAKAASTVSRYTDPFLAASKAVGRLYKGAKTGAQTIGGGMSASYSGPKIAAEAGYESAYGGKVAQSTVGKVGLTGDKAPGQAFLNPEEGILYQGLTEGKKKIKGDAQDVLDNDLTPIKADKTPVTLTEIKNALEAERDKAFYAGHPKTEGAVKAWTKIDAILQRWEKPAELGRLVAARAGDNAAGIVGADAVKALKGDPHTMTAKQYLTAWHNTHRTIGGFDELKKSLSDVHQGFRVGADKDPAAAAIAAGVVHTVIDKIEDVTRARGLPSYKEAMGRYSAKMKVIEELNDAFGRSKDAATRKMTASVRDTVFSNFRQRITLLNKLKESGVLSAKHLRETAAGEHMRGLYPRGLLGMASAAGMGAIAAVFSNPLGIAVAALHSPRLMGRAAYTAGKIEGLVLKPVLAVERMMNKVISTRAATLTAAQAGRASESGEDTKKVREAITLKAKEMGYNLHPRVIDGVVAKIMADDPETYIKGLNLIGKNKRLMEIIRSLGEQNVNKGAQ